jgi:hypothetical protein
MLFLTETVRSPTSGWKTPVERADLSVKRVKMSAGKQ